MILPSKITINRNLVYALALALVSPLATLWLLIRKPGFAAPRFLLMVLIIIYGLTLPMTEAADGYRHQQLVINEYLHMSWSDFFAHIGRIITFQSEINTKDLYQHFLSFFVGGILRSPELFFFFVSAIYAFFYSGVIIEVFRDFYRKHTAKTFLFWVFAVLFVLNRGPEGIQTVRTWTGLWVLFYGILRYEQTGSKKYLLLMLTAPLIHFGYFIMALPAYAVVLFGSYPRLLGVLFIFSTATNVFSLENFQRVIPEIGLVQSKLDSYGREQDQLTVEARLEKQSKKGNGGEKTWYKNLRTAGYLVYPKFLLVYLLFFFKIPSRFMNALEKKLYCVGLATFAGANILVFVTALNNRMEIIGFSFILASLVMMMGRTNAFQEFVRRHSVFRWLMFTFCVVMIPQFIFWLSFFLSQISTFFVAFPLYPIVFDEYNIALIDTIKWVIRYN